MHTNVCAKWDWQLKGTRYQYLWKVVINEYHAWSGSILFLTYDWHEKSAETRIWNELTVLPFIQRIRLLWLKTSQANRSLSFNHSSQFFVFLLFEMDTIMMRKTKKLDVFISFALQNEMLSYDVQLGTYGRLRIERQLVTCVTAKRTINSSIQRFKAIHVYTIGAWCITWYHIYDGRSGCDLWSTKINTLVSPLNAMNTRCEQRTQCIMNGKYLAYSFV